MMSKKRWDRFITYKDEIILRFFIVESSSGYVFGIKDKNLNDIHLTIIHEKDNQLIGAHVTDRSAGHIIRSESTSIDSDWIINELEKWKEKAIVNYHWNKKAFVMTNKLKERFEKWQSILLPSAKEIQLEYIGAAIGCDFSITNLWKKVRIREILKSNLGLGFIEERNKKFIVIPIDNFTMIQFSETQRNQFLKRMLKGIGFNDYFNFIHGKGWKLKLLNP